MHTPPSARRPRVAFRSGWFAGTYRRSHYLTHPWLYWHNLREEVRAFWQRGRYGYARRDWWSLDCYLCTWLPRAIRDYQDGSGIHHGEPDANGSWWHEHDT